MHDPFGNLIKTGHALIAVVVNNSYFTKRAVNGVATFTNLTTRVAGPVRLAIFDHAAGLLGAGGTVTLVVQPSGLDHLGWVQDATDIISGGMFRKALILQIYDIDSNRITLNTPITVAIKTPQPSTIALPEAFAPGYPLRRYCTPSYAAWPGRSGPPEETEEARGMTALVL